MSDDTVEVCVPVPHDAVGFPNREWQQLFAWPVSGGYRINNIPFFAKGLALDDVVAASERDGGLLVFEAVVVRSGHSTFRLWLSPEKQEDAAAVMGEVRRLGGLAEVTLGRLVAVDAPPDREVEIWDYLKGGQLRGHWEVFSRGIVFFCWDIEGGRGRASVRTAFSGRPCRGVARVLSLYLCRRS